MEKVERKAVEFIKKRNLKGIRNMYGNLSDQRKKNLKPRKSKIRLIIGDTKSMGLKRSLCGLFTLQKITKGTPQDSS